MNGWLRAALRWDDRLRGLLTGLGTFLPGLCLRLVLAGAVPCAAGVLLVAGLGTRYVAVALMVLAFVAPATVHFPADWLALAGHVQGPATGASPVNAALSWLYFLLLMVLAGQGPGRFSLDHLIARRNGLA